jgi:hypothetical protein
MKKTSLFPYGNSRTDKSAGRRREESGRKSREGTTEVGETGLDSCNVKGGTRGGGGVCVWGARLMWGVLGDVLCTSASKL